MTYTEAVKFVSEQIRPRYKTLNDIQAADWVSVAQRVELDVALSVVHDLVQDPELTLCVKSFKKLAWQRRKKATAREHIDPPGWDPWIRSLEAPKDHPTWEDREWFVTEGFRRADCGRQNYVADYAAEQAARVQAQYGGRWCGLTRPLDNTPYTAPLTQRECRAEAERRVIDGPDSPGRRFLLRYRDRKHSLSATLADALSPAGGHPPGEQVDPSRRLVEVMARPLAAAGHIGPTPFDPEHDPELQGDLPVAASAARQREPGED